jgi:hypothetical protein
MDADQTARMQTHYVGFVVARLKLEYIKNIQIIHARELLDDIHSLPVLYMLGKYITE